MGGMMWANKGIKWSGWIYSDYTACMYRITIMQPPCTVNDSLKKLHQSKVSLYFYKFISKDMDETMDGLYYMKEKITLSIFMWITVP